MSHTSNSLLSRTTLEKSRDVAEEVMGWLGAWRNSGGLLPIRSIELIRHESAKLFSLFFAHFGDSEGLTRADEFMAIGWVEAGDQSF